MAFMKGRSPFNQLKKNNSLLTEKHKRVCVSVEAVITDSINITFCSAG